MNRARDELLPGTGLAEDQDRCARRRDRINNLIYGAHFLGLTCQLVVVRERLELGGQLPILLSNRVLLDRLRYECLETIELLRVERLLDVVVRTLAHRLHG